MYVGGGVCVYVWGRGSTCMSVCSDVFGEVEKPAQ